VVTLCITSLTFTNSTFCPHTVFVCFVWIWEQTAIISLHSINWLVRITEMECFYCAVRTGCLYKKQVILVFMIYKFTTGRACLDIILYVQKHFSLFVPTLIHTVGPTQIMSNRFRCLFTEEQNLSLKLRDHFNLLPKLWMYADSFAPCIRLDG